MISLICNDSLPHNESIFEYVGTRNTPTNTYVSMLLQRKASDIMRCCDFAQLITNLMA